MPSKIDDPLLTEPDRRTRKRAARRDALVRLAGDIVEADGVDALTIAALAEAADYAPASLYTYFASRSALVAALQEQALHELHDAVRTQQARWDEALAASPDRDPHVTALARLWAFANLFVAAPIRYPRQFGLQQQLMTQPGVQDVEDALDVVPAAMLVLDIPHGLLADAASVGALAVASNGADGGDGTARRTLAWVSALNGVLMVDALSAGVASTGAQLGRELSMALLLGWGAPPATLAAAVELADGWDAA